MVRAAALARPRERKRSGLTLLEGPHLVEEAVEAGAAVLEVFALPGDARAAGLAQAAGARLVRVSREALERLAGTETPRGPVAVMRLPPARVPTRDLLDARVADPGNAGTILRTAAAFGLDVVLPDVDPWAPKVLRAAAGAHFRTTVAPERPDGWGVIATTATGGIAPRRLGDVLAPDRRWAILVGSEAHGLPPEEMARADVAVSIPMPGGTESLNAAVAAAVVAYELAGWRHPAETAGPSH